MTLVIIGSIICAIILYLLFVKMILFIDTANNEYYIKASGLVKANVESDKEDFVRVRIRTLFMNFYYYPLNKVGIAKKKKKTKKYIGKKRSSIGFSKVLRILQTFKINELFVDIDTGNCITNAKLYPLFTILNYNIGQFRINFEGKNQLILHIQNRPIHIIKSIINS